MSTHADIEKNKESVKQIQRKERGKITKKFSPFLFPDVESPVSQSKTFLFFKSKDLESSFYAHSTVFTIFTITNLKLLRASSAHSSLSVSQFDVCFFIRVICNFFKLPHHGSS